MKVLGIAGSPRRGGNTDLLLGEVMRGAASRRAKVKTIILNDLKITPCQHCDGCLETGRHYGQGKIYLNTLTLYARRSLLGKSWWRIKFWVGCQV